MTFGSLVISNIIYTVTASGNYVDQRLGWITEVVSASISSNLPPMKNFSLDLNLL